jgi:hypothetical protein
MEISFSASKMLIILVIFIANFFVQVHFDPDVHEISFSASKMLDFVDLAQYMAAWPKNQHFLFTLSVQKQPYQILKGKRPRIMYIHAD